MNHIEEQVNECVSGLQSLLDKIEEIGRMYRLTPAEVKLKVVLRSTIDEVLEERQKMREIREEHGIRGLPLEPRATTPKPIGGAREDEGI